MGLIKEPLEVDFYFNPRPITKEDEKAISDYIKKDKMKRMKKTRLKNPKFDSLGTASKPNRKKRVNTI